MKCCGCGKMIDINDKKLDNGVAKWYGKYKVETVIRVICHNCITDSVKKQEFLK